MIFNRSESVLKVRFILVSTLAIVSSIYYPLRIFSIVESGQIDVILLIANLLINGWDLVANYTIYKDGENVHGSLVRDLGTEKWKLWVAIDLIAFLPYEIFNLAPLLIFRSLKLLRLSQHQKLWRRRDLKRNDFVYIMFFLFWTSLAAHWLACGWDALEPVRNQKDELTVYIESLYWTVQTLTTVGYGDSVAETPMQMIYSMVVMMFGVGVYGWLIGNIAGILSKRDAVEQYYFDNMERLKALSSNRGLPLQLQNKIREYYDYMFSRNYSGGDEQIFMNTLPESLQQEVIVSLKEKIIKKINAFSDAPENFITEIAHELKMEIFVPGDIVFREGSKGDKLYFLLKGEMDVVTGEAKKLIAQLKNGDHFGEIALFKNTTRNATIVSKSYSEVYSLDKSAFQIVALKFPEIARAIMSKAEERQPERKELS